MAKLFRGLCAAFCLLCLVGRLVVDFGALFGGIGWPIGAQREPNGAKWLENDLFHLAAGRDRARGSGGEFDFGALKLYETSRKSTAKGPMPYAMGPKPQPIGHKRAQRRIPWPFCHSAVGHKSNGPRAKGCLGKAPAAESAVADSRAIL